MISDYRDIAFKLSDAAPYLSGGREGTASCSPASRLEPVVKASRTVLPATPAIPGPDAVRALLILAAESAFELRDGARDSMFLAQLREQSESLAHTLASLPEVHQGVDCSLMLRRARQAVAVLNETIRREILDKIDENTEMDVLVATLQVVKDVAAEAGKALGLMEVREPATR